MDFTSQLTVTVVGGKADLKAVADQIGVINERANDPALNKLQQNLVATGGAAKGTTQALAATRYALYDVGRTLGILGGALLGTTVAIYGVGIAWERNFANVIRTTPESIRTNSELIKTLRENFQDLASEIPITADALARIGTLAGQLGIPVAKMTEFTSVVARIAAVTNLSVEAAATAFGRLRALLPDVADGSVTFEELASTILAVGSSSVATETQIVSIASQISGIAAVAGFTADQVIGLASALASVGVQPELARGTVTRTLQRISEAASRGGEKLDRFAEIAGVSAKEFQDAYGTDKMGPIFLKLIQGLGDIDARGGDAAAAIRDLGITSVRDVPALLRLALAADSTGQAYNLLAEQLGIAGDEITRGTELAQQYSIINETIASKLQIVANNFQTLFAVISDGGGVLGGAIDAFNGLLEIFIEIAGNPVANFFIQGALGVGAFVGVTLLIAAAAAAGFAGVLALQLALAGLTGTTTATTFGVAALKLQLIELGAAGRVAAAGIGVARFGLLGLVAALGAVAGFAGAQAGVSFQSGIIDGLNNYGNEFEDTLKRLSGLNADARYLLGTDASDPFGSFLSDASRTAANIGLNSNRAVRDLKALDDSLATLAQNGNLTQVNAILKQVAEAQGVTVDQLIAKSPELSKQLKLIAAGSDTTTKAILEQTDAEAELIVATERLAATLGITGEELGVLQGNLKTGSTGFFGFDKILSDLQKKNQEWAQAQADATSSGTDSWQDFYDGSSVNIQDFSAVLEQQIADQKVWADNIAALGARGATALVGEFGKLGPAGAGLVAQALLLSDDDLGKLEDNARLAAFLVSKEYIETITSDMPLLIKAFNAGGIEGVQAMIEALRIGGPELQAAADALGITLPVELAIKTATAQVQLDNYLASNFGRSVTVTVNTRRGNGGTFASGGPIYGPGTGTSDSINARLSNGEYVIRASSVRKYGNGLFDQLNRGVAKFASGGPVGGGGGGAQFPSSMMTYWGPQERAMVRALGSGGSPTIVLDDIAIARASNRGNTKLSSQGTR